MDPSATVLSIDAIRDFRAALHEFCHEARGALVDVDLEVRRSLEWIMDLQPSYWQHEVRKREYAVTEAKNDLHRARMCTLPGGGTPSCMDERKALDRAQHRLREAHEKVELVRHWTRVEQHEVAEYEARATQLNTLLDGTMPRALSFLEHAIDHLDSYVAIAARGQSAASATSAAAGEPSGDDLAEPDTSISERGAGPSNTSAKD